MKFIEPKFRQKRERTSICIIPLSFGGVKYWLHMVKITEEFILSGWCIVDVEDLIK